MTRKKFLIPIGSAVAALLPVDSHALANASHTEKFPSDEKQTASLVKPVDLDQVIKQLSYTTSSSEAHLLLVRRSNSGNLYAGHGSHVSHSSHGSHRSGY